jgi:hypothetical protein
MSSEYCLWQQVVVRRCLRRGRVVDIVRRRARRDASLRYFYDVVLDGESRALPQKFSATELQDADILD